MAAVVVRADLFQESLAVPIAVLGRNVRPWCLPRIGRHALTWGFLDIPPALARQPFYAQKPAAPESMLRASDTRRVSLIKSPA